uniref:2EXR domain-containing protein n=1 Tax=Bionectria ochroleuca TaxID=29856 RepID=A0A8H7KC21_BIOOC
MASFHGFSDLPYELRLQIWEQSIRPLAKGYSGIHHLSISTYKEMSVRGEITGCHLKIPGINKTGREQVNRSASMWDVGLWTACWESRQVIMHHWNMEKMLERRRMLLDAREPAPLLRSWPDRKELCTTMNNPALYTGTDRRDLQLMIRPFQDAFYFDPKSLDEAANISMCRLNINNYLPFFERINGSYNSEQNFIFEFDPNWINDKYQARDLYFEKSPRGFIARLLWMIAEDLLDNCHIWLIDRSICQSSVSKEPDYAADFWKIRRSDRIFYTCDEEFVDVGMGGYRRFDSPWAGDCENMTWRGDGFDKCDEKQLRAALAREENGFAGWFVWLLAQENDNLTEVRNSYDPDLRESKHQPFWVEKHLHVLGYNR